MPPYLYVMQSLYRYAISVCYSIAVRLRDDLQPYQPPIAMVKVTPRALAIAVVAPRQ